MLISVGFGVLVAVLSGVVVGLWASITAAPVEVTAAISSALGAVLGLTAFSVTFLIRAARSGLLERLRARAANMVSGAAKAS